ncbi:hypothetical protein CBS147332_3041 [Penicillium roqueforti]|nr:hypothetical protein CBS147332_3041 [Penicillium roqueforti]KAI3125449.1 hypothetical protein CBS147331_443 [Penicillium roqueforti]
MALSLALMVRLALVGLVVFTSIASALPAPQVPRSTVQDPDTDPFYQPPAGFASEAPGTILSQRNITAAFFGLVPVDVEAYQLLYRTTAINGSAIATVTTVFKPKDAKLDRFVSFATAYDSSATKCQPSYTYQLGSPQDSLIASVELLIIDIYLALGYTVASPDYEGPEAAFGPGRLAGMGVLDGIRAVKSFKTLSLTDDPMVVGIGYSGGAIATGWAASLQPLYASELNIKGWAQGGTPANVTGTMYQLDNTAFSGLLPPAIAGLIKPSAYGASLGPFISEIITAEGQQILDAAVAECATADIAAFFERSIFDTSFQTLGENFIFDPIAQSVLKQNTMAANEDETPTAPTFVYHATDDEVIPYADAKTMVNSWCNWSANVKFTTYASGGHATTEIIAIPDVINFVQDAFAGTTASGCTTNTELGSILNPLALGVDLEPILVELIDALFNLGDQDSKVKNDPVGHGPQSWIHRCPIAFLITDSGGDNTHIQHSPKTTMHQHPRSSAVPSPPPNLPPRPTARDVRREQETAPSSPTVDMGSNYARGLGLEPGPQPSEQGRNAALGKEALTRLNQIISNYHTKAALIILHSRVALPPSFNKGSDSPRVNRWFNVELDDTDVLREPLRPWRTCDATDNRPPPLVIETYLDTKGLTNNQSLVIIDENGKRWDVRESLAALQGARAKPYQSENDEIILERWKIELGECSSRPPADLGSILPTVYKKSIVLFRSLFTYSKFLPAWRFSRRNKKLRQSPALQIKYRVVDGSAARDNLPLDHLTAPLSEGSEKVVDTYGFGVTESPAGPFSVQVTYRTNCDFRVDDSEALLSSRFMGADDEIFRPSLPSDDVNRPNPEVGSVPVERRAVESPDCTRAYGSLSTFHQVGPTTGASPISALRAMRDSGAGSPSPTESPKRLLPSAKVLPSGRAAQIAGESGGSSFPRRPSVSFQPFKAPPLSASPALADSPLGMSPRNTSRISTGTSADSRVMPPLSSAASARRPITIASEQAISSSNSASPKPAPISRYSSSFSHRRGRLSVGTNRLEDDNSSGRASATSSNAQPGSGLLTEATGTSAESIHADDENISDFLKMLDSKKDLMNSSTASLQPGPRQANPTAVALARFRGMRDSNAALSDSMSQSMHMHRSSLSSSKQLSGVPPMVAGTSVSTASSPGKPISPHTPHTPAIRSRLSSNSVADDIETDHRSRIPRSHHDPPLEEHSSAENTRGASSTAGAIDIPTSPRIFDPAYRRSSSAAVRRPVVTSDDDEIFPFGMRSLSLGADEPSHATLAAAQQHTESLKSQQSPAEGRSGPSRSAAGPYRDSASLRGQMSGPTSASASSNPHVYQPRFASSRGRGYSGGHSVSSASSSLARGANPAPHLVERDHDRDGNASGSNSGNSTLEIRRGSGQRPGAVRTLSGQAPEDDEPLLFAMSDFGVSRRSLDEVRHGNHGGAESAAGSRRGSGRRGAGLPGFHVWS